MNRTSANSGYTGLSIVVHWITAICVIALFLTHEGSRGSTEYFFHVSVGSAIGLFLLWRVWYRIRRGATEKADQAKLLNLASDIVRWGLLATIVLVVVTGYLLPWTRGASLPFLGLVEIPSPVPASHTFHEVVEEVHDFAGHLFVPLIALHVLGALKHAIIDRDGVLKRMVRSVNGGR